MGIRFETQEGRQGTLDVAADAISRFGEGTELVGVVDGIVQIKTPDGTMQGFALGHWSEQFGARIVFMDGFNSPETAINRPPNGLNYFDQSVFYNDGMDMNALQDLYPRSMKNEDGTVVVLDNDGLWKVMWAPNLRGPEAPLNMQEEIHENLVNDPRLVMRTAGVVFMLGVAGISATTGKKGFKVNDIVKALRTIQDNAPHENKFQINKIINQTTGIETWKMDNAYLNPESVGYWLEKAQKVNSFQFRMMQMQAAEKTVAGMRSMAMKDFHDAMGPLLDMEETANIRINLQEIVAEFVQFLVGLDLLRDISRSTGLNEWVSLSEDAAYDPNLLPEMPAFVGAFVTFLRVVMPISEKSALAFAKGKKGFKGIMHIMTMIDECIYSLAGVPDSAAKFKMFMALKQVQSKIESKLSFHYHPDPLKDKRAVKENMFMQAKSFYSPKREQLYKLCQLPRESWNNTILEGLRQNENLEVFYDSLPKGYARMLQDFACMDTAYDMQPWVDVNHADRTHDAFSQYQESFGLTPPEAGYLAKNSPRAVQNIAETIIASCAYIAEEEEQTTINLLRNPFLMANFIKTMMVASVNRELGIVEVLSKFGIAGTSDPEASPDSARIWDDPEAVKQDNDARMKEMLGQIAMEEAINKQRQEAQGGDTMQMQESLRDGGQSASPSGPATRAMPVRKAG